MLTSIVYLICAKYFGLTQWPATLISFRCGLPLPPRGDLVLLGRTPPVVPADCPRRSEEAHHPQGEDAPRLGTGVRLSLADPFVARKVEITAAEFFEATGKLSGLLFVVSSMLAMGLSLTVPMILQPLKNVRLVILALLANFVLVPLLAYLITLIMPLEQSLKVGLIVLSTAAGAPFCPSWCRAPRGTSPSAWA